EATPVKGHSTPPSRGVDPKVENICLREVCHQHIPSWDSTAKKQQLLESSKAGRMIQLLSAKTRDTRKS
ncbi:hypothetical protein ACQP3F_33940, partial [Escherichia coli]